MSIRNLILLFLTCICSCSPYPKEVKEALKYAGNNRRQLEQVLEHYSKASEDSLKLRAAKFLIANMPGHWSYEPDVLDAYYASIDTILNRKVARNLKIEQLNRISFECKDIAKTVVEDIHIITGEYLIKNIDQAFDVWQNEPWAKHVLFDDFCEYLLPYKVAEGQPLDYWRDSLKGKYCEKLEFLKHNQVYKNSPFRACLEIRNNMRRKMKPRISFSSNKISLLAANNITKLPEGSCNEYAQAVLAVMRSNGIPVAIDMLPQWPHKGGCGGHSWNFLLDNSRNHIIFEELNGVEPGNTLRPSATLGKVYRNTYAINKKLLRMQDEDNLPKLFRNIFLKDVTSEYAPVGIAVIDIYKKTKTTFAYLAVFDNKQWEPIAFGNLRKSKAKFIDVCKNVAYLPVYYTGTGQEPLNYPFILEYSGNLRYLVPDTTTLKSVVLTRKYPVFTKVVEMTMRTVGAKIQASDTKDFKNPVMVHQINEWHAAGIVQIPDSLPPFQYWRFCSPDKEYCNIAELMFFRTNDTIPYAGKIIGQDKMYKNDSIYCKENAFDNDPLTNFHSASKDSAWVGMDFGIPIKIEKIIYLPRSDDNNIRLGDEYELYYWNRNGWNSLGNQKAKDLKVRFDNVPDNALLWLRNLTRGNEERIFTYENEQQVWW